MTDSWTTKRPTVEAMEEILGETLRVLDDGFVRVIDYMGSDASVVQAARVSYGSGTKRVSEDRQLIRYLMRHAHTTPFEMCELKLHVRVPMDCWRQWVRHRTASVNEYSTRYSLAIDSAQVTQPFAWREQSDMNKQGSSDGMIALERGRALSERESELHRLARDVYLERIEAGVAREQARKDLPLCSYTEAYWKTDLHNLLHFLRLRMDSMAQLEIRSFADLIGERIVSRWVPLTWEAFQDYGRESMHLSRMDAEFIAMLTRGEIDAVCKAAADAGWTRSDGEGGIRKGREALEFEEKLEKLDLDSPWA